jgi:colicin import membrane protein
MSSEYEHNIATLLAEKNQKLLNAKKNPVYNKFEIESLTTEVDTLQCLFENYNLGMNYFRRAQGGRSTLRD